MSHSMGQPRPTPKVGGQVLGTGILLLATFLWGSSFPVIKIVMENVDSLTYTWVRSLLSLLALAPYLAYKAARGQLDRRALAGGLLAGVAYTLGLWLQGLGTKYTTASNSGFITGLHMVFVHLYVASVTRKYSPNLAAGLGLAVVGVYLLTTPSTGFNRGDALVLLGAVFWAAQVIVVDRYSDRDIPQFLAAQFLVSLSFIVPDHLQDGIRAPSPEDMLLLTYLAVVTGVGAFGLQVLGQRYLGPAASTIVYQMEPVFAALLARLVLGESMTPMQMLGGALILAAMFVAGRGDVKTPRPRALPEPPQALSRQPP